MDTKKLDTAVAEARRFIERVEALPAPRKVENSHFEKGYYMDDNFPKHTGAIRRASMDLTRALADLRKPQS